MDFALSDEQQLLQEAARNALGRVNTLEAAREALDGSELPDMWPTAREAGWSGLLIAEEHGGAALGALDAMLVAAECGRQLAPVPLLGHIPATGLLDAAGAKDVLPDLASGEKRAAFVPALPPGDLEDDWTVDARTGHGRVAAPKAEVSGDDATVTGEVAWVPDAPGADLLVVVATDGARPVAVLVDAAGDGVTVEAVWRFDATRALGHVRLDGARGRVLALDEAAISGAWHLTQGLIAAESLGAVETALEVSLQYAKERFTFGRPIGSYQAIKHQLTEILRRMENTRSLIYYAGWAAEQSPDELPLAASAARTAGGAALDHASRTMIAVHGGIGATWEHDAPLFFRRAQINRRLLGGTGASTDRVAGELLAQARAA